MTGLREWFADRPMWLQDAARRLLEQSELTAIDLSELVALCKQEAEGDSSDVEAQRARPLDDIALPSSDGQKSLRLKSIGEIAGINALAPREPLQFGDKPITIIYGSNGTGKSGYKRFLKHACGARAPGELLGNVYAESPGEKSCKIGFELERVHHDVKWSLGDGAISDLKDVAIYDTDSANIYVNNEHEVTYEPPRLGLFRRLVDACGHVDQAIKGEISARVSVLPSLPSAYDETSAGSWLPRISPETTPEDVTSRSEWSKGDDDALAALTRRLLEPDAPAKATALRRAETNLSSLEALLRGAAHALSNGAYRKLVDAKRTAIYKRRAVSEDAVRVFADAPVDGVASESWRLLWEKARLFSESAAFPSQQFPVVDADARSVLCQQPLAEDSKGRMRSFERFVKGSLEQEATASERTLEAIIEELPDLPDADSFDSMLESVGVVVAEGALRDEISDYLDSMMTKYSRYEHAQPEEAPVEVPEPDELEEDLQELKRWLVEFSGRDGRAQ